MQLLATIPPPPGNVLELGPLTIHYYGIAIAIGVVAAISLLRRRYAALGGDPELADRVGLWAVGMGLVGARLAYVSTNLDRFLFDDILGIFRVWEGGLAFFGGLLFGTLTAIYLVRRWGGSLVDFADATAPTIPLAQAFGRWGNYFNQELYGTPTDLPWALELELGGEIVATVHPTFLYEIIGNVAIIAVLIWLGRNRKVPRGSLMFVYVIGYGILRFATELIRTDTDFRLLGISRNGYVALLIIIVGIVGMRWRARQTDLAVGELPAAEHARVAAALDPERAEGEGAGQEPPRSEPPVAADPADPADPATAPDRDEATEPER
jgi:prolipoprotein diacylglyceryl transferase